MANENTLTKPPAEESADRERTRGGRHYRPAVDILEMADELLVVADVPGADRDKIDIQFEEGTLTISAEVEPRQPQDTEYLLEEYGVGDYYRSFQVSEKIDSERITAELAAGVLTLHLPKAGASKPRKIAIATSA
ncbi:MAG TPA: Hsp20/alpha crystallin family protein [Thermoguttaceae bacterium]|nr:Hsp20/alpha crystallin family protein [Thermoguttaceae bacterium]